MADPLQFVIPGTPLPPPSARSENMIRRAAKAERERGFGIPTGNPLGSTPQIPALTCFMQNQTNLDLAAGSVLAVGSAITNPESLPLDAQQSPSFNGGLVTNTSAPFVITSDAIPSNSGGFAVLAGLAVVKVDVTDLTHTRAVPIVGDATKLASASSGGVRLWYTPGVLGVRQCMVLLGSDSLGSTTALTTGSDFYSVIGSRPAVGNKLTNVPVGKYLAMAYCQLAVSINSLSGADLICGISNWPNSAVFPGTFGIFNNSLFLTPPGSLLSLEVPVLLMATATMGGDNVGVLANHNDINGEGYIEVRQLTLIPVSF